MNGTYSEGDVFAVPLDGGGFGLGLVARARNRFVLGYFFDAIVHSLPRVEEVRFERDDAVAANIFGDDGLVDGTWPVLGQLPQWDRDIWVMPWFVDAHRQGQVSRILSSYYPDDPTKSLGRQVVSAEQAERLPPDTFSPRRAQEIGMDVLLHRTPRPLPRVRVIPGPAAPPPQPELPAPAPAPEEAVRLYFELPARGLTAKTQKHLELFEEMLDEMLRDRGLGYLGGNEWGDGPYVMYFYGGSRSAIWAALERYVRKHSPLTPVAVYLREADLDAEPTLIDLRDQR